MPKIDVYKSSHLVYGSTGNIDMLSTEDFFYFQKGIKGQLQHTVYNEVSALADGGFQYEYVDWARNTEVSVVCINGCPY